MSERGLGRGLLSVFGEDSIRMEDGNQTVVQLTKIEPNSSQPRRDFDAETLSELAESIKKHGLISPIAVRKLPNGRYQIIAGERRWRACRMAGLTEAPVIIIDADDKKVLEIALIENLQREDLNPFEEAEGFRSLMDKFGMTQEDIAQRVGKSRSAIANSLRILNLPEEIKAMVAEHKISIGHARVLLSLDDQQKMVELALIVEKQELSVRQTEAMVKRYIESINADNKKKEKIEGVDYAAELSRNLSDILGRRVKISCGKNKGTIELEYYGLDDLELLTKILSSDGFKREKDN